MKSIFKISTTNVKYNLQLFRLSLQKVLTKEVYHNIMLLFQGTKKPIRQLKGGMFGRRQHCLLHREIIRLNEREVINHEEVYFC